MKKRLILTSLLTLALIVALITIVAGCAGEPGLKGSQGPIGLQGIQGEQGELGPIGSIGLQGEPGPKGSTGAKGATGSTGTTGAQGIQGEQGERGPSGGGSRGATGSTGPQGPAGSDADCKALQARVSNLEAKVAALEKEATTIRVPRDYSTIQAAVAAAESGYTIIVAAGTYYETIDVTKNNLIIQSVSDDPSDTIIDGSGDGSGVVVTIANCSGVTLSGFIITGAAGGSRGIQMLGATGCTISNIVVTETGPLTAGRECAAFYLEGSSGNSFDSVTVSEISGGQITGILLTGSNSNTFASTTISGITASGSGTPEAKGIWVTGGENNEFVDTEVTRIISDSRACGIYADGNGNTFTSTEVSGIQGGTRVSGIQIRRTTGVEFSDYHVSDIISEAYDSWGIKVFDGVTDCTFSGGSITGADIGFFVEKNDLYTGNSIHNTNIVGNTLYGIKNTSGEPVDATNNWWGTKVETDIQAMISGNVLYIPISTEPH